MFDFFALSEATRKFINSFNESISNSSGEEKKILEMKIEEVLKKYTDNLMSMSGVVGIGQGLCDGEPCIKVFLIRKTQELGEKIPRELEGYKVKIEETDKFRAYPEI